MAKTYATHMNARTATATLCNQRSTVSTNGTQFTTTNAAEVTCTKCLLMMNRGAEANNPKNAAAAEKALKAAAREVKTAEKDLAAFVKNPAPVIRNGETMEAAIARTTANYEAQLATARAALVALEA